MKRDSIFRKFQKSSLVFIPMAAGTRNPAMCGRAV